LGYAKIFSLYCLHNAKFGQLIPSNIVKMVATKPVFKAKMHQIRFEMGLQELTPLPQAVHLDLKGLLLREEKGREGTAGEETGNGRGAGFLPLVKSEIRHC